MNMLSKISILVISGLVVLASSSLYVISEVERGVTLRFGEMAVSYTHLRAHET